VAMLARREACPLGLRGALNPETMSPDLKLRGRTRTVPLVRVTSNNHWSGP
jgi:hypothetical protein